MPNRAARKTTTRLSDWSKSVSHKASRCTSPSGNGKPVGDSQAGSPVGFAAKSGSRNPERGQATRASLQQVLDCGLQLLRILGPVAIDFQAMGSDSSAVCSAPLMQRLVGGS